MNLQQIIKNAEKSIEYFKFKLEFAKSKNTHAMNLNYLITFYNTFEKVMKKELKTEVLNSLLLTSLIELTDKYGFNIAISKMNEIITKPHQTRKDAELYFLDYFSSNLIEKLDQEQNPIKKNSIEYKIFRLQDKTTVNEFLDEITMTLNEQIKWNT